VTWFDLIFIAAFLFTAGSLLAAAIQIARRRANSARRIVRRVAIFAAAYFAIEIAVALSSPQRVLAAGDTRRFDDWCIAVMSSSTAEQLGPSLRAAPDKFVLVTFRVSSTAGRIRQAARDAAVYATDASGRQFEVFALGQAAFEAAAGPQTPLTQTLDPRSSFQTVRIFRVPAPTPALDIHVRHGAWPGWFIIGGEGSFFHPPTVIRVPLPR
jgi:hypothetical protein